MILHIPAEKERDKVKGDNVQAGSKTLSNAMVSVNDSDPMGAGQITQCILANVPMKVKISTSDKVINTYAFLDPGSSATFCTDSLKRKLNVSSKNTTNILCTMGQEKKRFLAVSSLASK